MKALESIEKPHTEKAPPEFRVGDLLRISIKVKEGDKTRSQFFEGICIARRGRGINASFSVVKETHGDLVQKIFPVYSPNVEKITVVRKGKAHKAKLYHLLKKK